MDLHSGLPYWIIKNSLYNYFNPLEKEITTEVAIIGTGITGSLVAHELCKAGVKCAIFDKRTIATGSTAASTAQLQYEIDVPLHKLINDIGEENAVKAYKDCLKAISDIETTISEVKGDGDFLRVPTIYYTTNQKGKTMLLKEYEARKKAKLPVTLLDEIQLLKKYNIKGLAALENNESAQLDAFKTSVQILKHHQDQQMLDIYTHTEIEKANKTNKGYELITSNGNKINCKYVIIATGFEAGKFLPKKIMKLESTYVIISQPIHEKQFWKNKSLLWNTSEPYLYLRSTRDNRIIVGGEDEEFQDPIKRDDLLRDKVKNLEKKFNNLFPEIPFKTEMAWCGTFSSTKDGLPYIGPYTEGDKMLFALGYGGNGITFSSLAAKIIANIVTEKEDDRLVRYSFNR